MNLSLESYVKDHFSYFLYCSFKNCSGNYKKSSNNNLGRQVWIMEVPKGISIDWGLRLMKWSSLVPSPLGDKKLLIKKKSG
jgi:hypothetical protein